MKMKSLIIGMSGMVAALFLTNEIRAQVSTADSTECVAQYSVMAEYMKQKNYELALPAWRFLWATCPAQYQGVYVYGNTLFKDLIKNAKDENLKKAYIDTLFAIHDKRLELAEINPTKFGDKGSNLSRKAVDFITYRKDETEEAYNLLKAAFENSGEKQDANVVMQYMAYAERKRLGKTLECNDIIDLYASLSDAVEKNFNSSKDSVWVKVVQPNLDKFAEKCLDCEALLAYYSRSFETNKANAEWLSKAAGNLDKKQCAKKEEFRRNPVIGQIFLAYAEVAQNADAYVKYALYLISIDKTAESEGFFTKAIQLETDNDKKAQYFLTIAKIQAEARKYSQARENARKAAGLKSGWGDPYLLIGDMYAASAVSCGGDDPKVRGAIYSAAVDKYMQAASVDPSVAERANSQAARCRANYPTQQDVFFDGAKEGDQINIGCWIGETATLRLRK